MRKSLTAVIRREGGGYFALCPELDVASQGDTIEEVKANLKEAVELFLECASEEEIDERHGADAYVSSLELEIA